MKDQDIDAKKWAVSTGGFVELLRYGQTQVQTGEYISFHIDGNVGDTTTIFEISGIEVNEIVIISDIHFENSISIWDSSLKSLYFNNCTFSNNFSFTCTNIDGELSFIYCNLVSLEVESCNIEKFRLGGGVTVEDISLKECDIKKEVHLIYCTIKNSLTIFLCSILGKISIEHSTILHTVFEGSSFTEYSLNDIPEKGSLILLDVEFQKLNTYNAFTNLGYMQWNNLVTSEDVEINIIYAVMGKWDIINCDLSQGRLIIYSSKIVDAFYANTEFPKVLSISVNISEDENVHEVLRDGYNQLKTIAQKQNDRKTFLHYQSEELNSYYNALDLFSKNWATKIQLAALKFSSNYGTSWTQAVVVTVLINLFFIDICYWNYLSSFQLAQFWSYVGKFMEFLFSVIKKPDFVHTGYQTSIYYISRIFIAFGIYQTIAAFRKFGKSD